MVKLADRVKETTTVTGTGAVSMGGAVAGFRGFSTAFTTGDQVYYCIDNGAEWEVGIGTLASGTPWTMARTTVLASSNSNTAVSFSAGTKSIYCTAPAATYRLASPTVDTLAEIGALAPATSDNWFKVSGNMARFSAVVTDATSAGQMAVNTLAMTAVAASSTAMTAVAASSTAMTAVAASPTAMSAVAASSTAREPFFGSSFSVGAGLNTLVVSGGGTSNTTLSGIATMTAVAASSTAMTAVAASSTAMSAVAASFTAMTAVAASSTAMTAVAASSTAKTAIHGSDTALNAIAVSSTARTAMRSAAQYSVVKWMGAGTSQVALSGMTGTKYILVGMSWEAASSGYTTTAMTLNPGSNIATTYNMPTVSGTLATDVNMAVPLVAPYKGYGSNGNSGVYIYFGVLRCDV